MSAIQETAATFADQAMPLPQLQSQAQPPPSVSAVGLPKWPLIYQFNSYLKFCISKHGVEQASSPSAPPSARPPAPPSAGPSAPPSALRLLLLVLPVASCKFPFAHAHDYDLCLT